MPLPPGSPQGMVPRGEDWIVRRFEELERKQAADIASMNAAALATSTALSTQLSTLTTQQATLTAQQGTLTTQQAALTSQLGSINALLGSQVDGTTGTASASPTLNTTQTGYAAITFTVPSGYTRAMVMGVSAMYAGGIVATVLRNQINGTSGPDMFAFTNAAYANATAANAAALTGLTGGGTFTVQSVANTSTSTTSAVIITAAIVTWLK